MRKAIEGEGKKGHESAEDGGRGEKRGRKGRARELREGRWYALCTSELSISLRSATST